MSVFMQTIKGVYSQVCKYLDNDKLFFVILSLCHKGGILNQSGCYQSGIFIHSFQFSETQKSLADRQFHEVCSIVFPNETDDSKC